jgi:hypothetical protein
LVVWGAIRRIDGSLRGLFCIFPLFLSSSFFISPSSFFLLLVRIQHGESEIRERVRDREREIERDWEIERERIRWIRELETRERTGEPVT